MYFRSFILDLLKKREQKATAKLKNFLNAIDVRRLSEDQVNFCVEDLTEKDLHMSLRIMQNDKSPGNADLTNKFYETTWDELKEVFADSVKKAKEK